jgi:ankyrin repeat protein
MMESLLKHGAVIDATDKQNGVTPLHVAAATYNKTLVDFLLWNGADPLRRTKDGRTPMQLAQRSEFGTGLLGIATQGDVQQKAATIDALRAAVSRHPIAQ